MKKLRWGLLSTANINQRVIPAIRESSRGDLVAVASRSKEKATTYVQKWEIPNAFGSYEDLLMSGCIDIVYINLPNHLHAEWSIKAMHAGVHVLCEKPFAITLDEVDAMIAAKEETGMVLAEAFMYRHHPQTKITGELVHSGKIGEITMVRSTFDFTINRRENVRLVPTWGGGCLWDVGVYPLSFAQFIMGEPPEWVMGSQWLGESGVDETFSGLLVYHGNRFAQISCAFRTPFYTFAEVTGTLGRLYLNMPFVGVEGGVLTFYPRRGDPEIIRVPEVYLYRSEITDMHDAIIDGAPNYLSLQETRDHVRTVLALYESARTQSVVRL